MQDHFGKTLKSNKEGVNEIVKWLKERIGLVKQADCSRIIIQFHNTFRNKGQDLLSYIKDYEKAYADVKKMGETYSSTTRAILMLSQANLTNIDHQLITNNINLDPADKDKDKHFEQVKDAMKKFQHMTTSNNPNAVIGFQCRHNNTSQKSVFLAEQIDEDEVDDDLIEHIKTYVVDRKRSLNRYGARSNRDNKEKKIWKCSNCLHLCPHPKWKPCECDCSKHKKEQCPHTRKRQGDGDSNQPTKQNKQMSKNDNNKEKGYLTYQTNFQSKISDVQNTFVVNHDIAVSKSNAPQSLDVLFNALREKEKEAVVHVSPTDRGCGPTVLQRMQRAVSPSGRMEGVSDLQSASPCNGGKWSPTMLTEVMVPTKVVLDPQGGQAKGTAIRSSQRSVGSAKHSEVIQPDPVQVLKLGAGPQTTLSPDEETHSVYQQGSVPDRVTDTEVVYIRNENGSDWDKSVQQVDEETPLYAIIDSASPSTIIGFEDFHLIKSQYPRAVQETFVYQESDNLYQFGGGETTHSLGAVKLPVYILDTEHVAHRVNIKVDILNQKNLPLLLGGKSLIAVKANLDFKEMTISCQWGEDRSEFPIERRSSGHFILQFFPLSQQDDQSVRAEFLEEKESSWSQSDAADIVNYLISKATAEVYHVMSRQPRNLRPVNKRGAKKARQAAVKPLTAQEVNRLHQVFGHVNKNKLRDLVRKSGRCDDNTLLALDALDNCEVCAVENSRIPRPRVAFPRAANFNHVVTLDLKENRRYRNAPPYILYCVDSFTKFKAARFISNKSGDTVAEAFMLEWIKLFGAPEYLMSDRGKEMINPQLRSLCQMYGIKFTSTASHSPHQNSINERGHFTVDRSMDRLLTADPSLKPQVALAWAVQACNTLQMVGGFSSFQLVFGRNPSYPSITEAEAGFDEDVTSKSDSWAVQYRTMMAAREAFAAVQADITIKKALEQRIYSNYNALQKGDWIYFKRNPDKHWQGPAKLVTKDGKRLHLIHHGQLIVVNADDVLLNKPEDDEEPQQYVSLPARHSPPDQIDSPEPRQPTEQGQRVGCESDAEKTSVMQTPSETAPPSPVRSDPAECQDTQCVQPHPSAEDQIQSQTEEDSQHQGEPDSVITSAQTPATSTTLTKDQLGLPVMCNVCNKETSSKNIQKHCQEKHNIPRANVRAYSTVIDARPDSLFMNLENLKSGTALSDDQGKYFVLKDPTTTGWTAHEVASKQDVSLDYISDMVEMRVLGDMESQQQDGFYVSNRGQSIFIELQDYTKKVFISSLAEQAQEESLVPVNSVFVVNIPRRRHGEAQCVAAKMKELNDFDNYDVYEVVDRPQGVNIIDTQWVLVEKERMDGSKVTKARLCMRGDQELNKHLIPVDSPTTNKISVRLLLTLAVALGWDVSTADIERAFLQTEDLARDVFVRPPVEMGLPRDKVLKLNRAAYGLLDASRSFFLKQAREFANVNFMPLKFDPATFVNKPSRDAMLVAAAAVHVDDALNVGEKEVVEEAQKKMSEKLTYGSIEQLPFRFLGVNMRRGTEGELILDQQHYVNSLELPDTAVLNKFQKQDVLPDDLQSDFRSIASKLNMLSGSCRPDFVFGAKFLTTRYGKATKSDFTMAVKMLKKAKQETTETIVPNLGDIKDWILVGVSDASNKTNGNIFSIGGHVVMLVNKFTSAASIIHYSSKRIDRVVADSTAAETIALQKACSSIYFVKQLLSEMCGKTVEDLQCVVLTDSHNLWSNIHHLKSSADHRMLGDIINIRQDIFDNNVIQEVRFCHGEQNIADSLTKVTKSGQALLNIARSGRYEVPGGTIVRDSTLTATRTYHQLMFAEQPQTAPPQSLQNKSQRVLQSPTVPHRTQHSSLPLNKQFEDNFETDQDTDLASLSPPLSAPLGDDRVQAQSVQDQQTHQGGRQHRPHRQRHHGRKRGNRM